MHIYMYIPHLKNAIIKCLYYKINKERKKKEKRERAKNEKWKKMGGGGPNV